MVDNVKLISDLKKLGVEFFTGVPDSLLNDFCLTLEKVCDKNHNIIAANEGNAIGIASGYYLATNKIPVVYMQNSGIGNAMNPLLSLTHDDVYAIPMILVIGWRGDPSIKDHAQHKRQGELTPILMDEMNIPYILVSEDSQVLSSFENALNQTKSISSPVALIIRKGILSKAKKDNPYPDEGEMMNREDAMDLVFDMMPENTVFTATTGRATRELNEMFVKRNLEANRQYLNVGSMGHNSSVTLGMAVGSPEFHYVCFDGDAATIMHMGAMSIIGKNKPKHFLHVILNNGVHESVGGQISSATTTNLTLVAKACGYNTVGNAVSTAEELRQAVEKLRDKDGPSFIEVRIRKGIRSRIPGLKVDLKKLKEKIMGYLQSN